MKKRWAACVVSMGLAGSGLALARVDLSGLDEGMHGQPAQVLVLGTMHLSGMQDGFRRESLDPLMDRLAAFKPEVITIEAISGEGCDLMARHPTVYGEGVSAYCRHTDEAKAATGLDVPAAIAAVDKTLADWPAKPTAAQRRHLAALFMAANDRPSAVVQWLQLPPGEQHAGDGLDAALVEMLGKLASHNNENYSIGARLAARLGLQRVFAVDDHTGDNVRINDEAGFEKAIRAAWDGARPKARPIREREAELARGEDMLALYRYINSAEMLRVAVDVDFGAAMRDPSPQRFGQFYVAGWDTRNLRMVANVRAAFRERPGARVLSIVGSSHKPWFDNLLGMMQGVKLVDVVEFLQLPGDKPVK
ncbi:MAG TPA: DUF5694 domain-containing protein [Dokdonella sp.]